jgi:hypothetical protein
MGYNSSSDSVSVALIYQLKYLHTDQTAFLNIHKVYMA